MMGKSDKECKATLPEAEVCEFQNEENRNLHGSSDALKGRCFEVRARLRHYLHHHYFQIVVCALVLFDTAVVVTEILLESSTRYGSKNHGIEIAERVLHYTSLSILSFFMIELKIKLFAMGKEFFRHKIEMFDAVVVTVSFFLDIFLSSGGLKDAVEFLVLLRLWRITRVINGIIMSIKTRAEERENKLKEEVQMSEEKCSKLQNRIKHLEDENRHLKGQLQVLSRTNIKE